MGTRTITNVLTTPVGQGHNGVLGPSGFWVTLPGLGLSVMVGTITINVQSGKQWVICNFRHHTTITITKGSWGWHNVPSHRLGHGFIHHTMAMLGSARHWVVCHKWHPGPNK